MQKPITLIRREFTEKIVDTINNSGLPFFVIEPILQNLLTSVQQGAKAQEENDRAEYERHMEEDLKVDAAKNNAVPSETKV